MKKLRWGNKILALDDPDGDTRIDREHTGVKSRWLLDGEDYWAGSYSESCLAVLNELYRRHPIRFDEIISDPDDRPHGPKTALYIVFAEEIDAFTNNGEYAKQICDSDIYLEADLCSNDLAELTLAMARSLGYGHDRFVIVSD